MARRLLTIDDDPASGRLIQAIFTPEGFDVLVAADGASGLAMARRERPDIALVDLHLPDGDGLELLGALRAIDPQLVLVMLTANADLRTAVRATRLGAFDYLTKPIDHEEIVVVVRRALETHELRTEVEDLRRQLGGGADLATQMGPSEVVRRVSEQVRTVAASDFSVLILGETGTGKELVAQALHRHSDRRTKPFLALDCGAIPESLLESELFGHEKGAFTGAERRKEGRFLLADGGTLFLDEIGNLAVGLQAKLLRAIESRVVQAVGATTASAIDVRFVAATHADLPARVAAGQFRADLYFRLAQYTVTLPPLRDRVEDVAYLARRFVEEASVELRRPMREIADDALALLARHPWPGNVRELRNVVRQGVLESTDHVLRAADVERFLRPAADTAPQTIVTGSGESLREIATRAARSAEREAIVQALRATNGNKSQAARALSTDYKTLHLKMKSLEISARDFRA